MALFPVHETVRRAVPPWVWDRGRRRCRTLPAGRPVDYVARLAGRRAAHARRTGTVTSISLLMQVAPPDEARAGVQPRRLGRHNQSGRSSRPIGSSPRSTRTVPRTRPGWPTIPLDRIDAVVKMDHRSSSAGASARSTMWRLQITHYMAPARSMIERRSRVGFGQPSRTDTPCPPPSAGTSAFAPTSSPESSRRPRRRRGHQLSASVASLAMGAAPPLSKLLDGGARGDCRAGRARLRPRGGLTDCPAAGLASG